MGVELVILVAIVVLAPLLFPKVSENLEAFLFAAGLLAATLTSSWSLRLLRDALVGPLTITGAVLGASFLFYLLQRPLEAGVSRLRARLGLRPLVFALVAVVGLLSSFVTAIVASLVMVEAVERLKLDARNERLVAVLACFAIGLGAALTPFGEPLAAVAISKLSGEPYRAGTWFLLRTLWPFVIPGVLVSSLLSVVLLRRDGAAAVPEGPDERETPVSVLLRTGKVYIFVVGLILLGAAFTPVVDRFVGSTSYLALFWANITSAFLDNATLTAAEIVPAMSQKQIVASLMGLLIAGGMLVPGNIPNIVAAGRLKIDSRAWARIGIPVGLAMMVVMFAVLAARA